MTKTVHQRRGRGRWTAGPGRPLSLVALERGSLADRTADSIRALVLRGHLAPGQRLESMRKLAEELGVSLPVVREAAAQLKGEGLLHIRQGLGMFVVRRQGAARSLRAVRRRASRTEAAELRISVDPAVARSAAARRTADRLAEMHFALGERRLAARAGDTRSFTKADLAFHLAVAKASRNGLGIGIHRMGTRLLQPQLAAKAADHARNHRLAELHRALFEAIEMERPARAERAARAIAAIEVQPP